MRFALTGLLLLCWGAARSVVGSEAPANLLRNADLQDDWITLLPENKNHHWCYSTEFFNRRDFNPDAWICRGSWRWIDEGEPRGRRRLVLRGPGAEVSQRVNWVAVHDDRQRSGFPDAGGFPNLKPQRSSRPSRLVRDLAFRVLLKGRDVPKDAGTIEVGLALPGAIATGDPMGSVVPPSALASAPLPSGTYDGRWAEATLKASAWREGPVLPGTAAVAIRYKAPTGSVEAVRAELIEAAVDFPNLLPNGGFEIIDEQGHPSGWSRPLKYDYFPPGLYYLFNTWHNANSENRGPVAADMLVCREGGRSLKMIVAAGDEKAVVSEAIILNQTEPRLIEVRAWIKTDQLAMLQIDARDEQGRRLDGFNFIHKAPASIGTDDWRIVRQVFRPRFPVKSLRLLLCARGVNGCTLDDTGAQPQNNVVGTIWWDGVRLFEPESAALEAASRGEDAKPLARLENLELGELLIGRNELTATLFNGGPSRSLQVRWEFTSPMGKASVFETDAAEVAAQGRLPIRLPYELTEPCPTAYTEYRGKLSVRDGAGKEVGATELWFGTWTTPIDLEIGAIYLRPEQRQFVRMNLGFSAATIAALSKVQIEVVRRGTGVILKGWELREVPKLLPTMRKIIPIELREDFRNLLMARLDVSFLPLQPFRDPQRNWFLRVRAIDGGGHEVAHVESPPFCRLAHDDPQPAVKMVAIRDGFVRVNDRPWMPWGAAYGFVPVYAGHEGGAPSTFRDLHNLPEWNLYDRFTSEPYTRRANDLNCLRYVAGSITDPAVLDQHWKEDNLYASTAYVTPQPAFSRSDLVKQAGGRTKLENYLSFCREAPMIVSTAPGIEEAFGLFQAATPEQIQGLGQVVASLRERTGKPVMVAHGGFWNRLEFEKVPYFDIYDPETEPLFPADLQVDLNPLIAGRNKAVWLRPQMYEDVPYERWRFHVYVELMRGCRGWQIAHGPGDASLFRGLHGEMEFMKPLAASTDPGPEVTIEPPMEHWSRRHDGKLYVIAATTRGIPFGNWREAPVKSATPACRISRETFGEGVPAAVHGLQSFPDARRWRQGSKLAQWVWLTPEEPPKNLVALVKADGRWVHSAARGDVRSLALRTDLKRAFWFLKSFYRTAEGFLGWDETLVPSALEYVPELASSSPLPTLGKWTRLEISLDRIGASAKLLEGIGFLHEGGRVYWGRTSLIDPAGKESVVWGDSLALPPEQLARTTIHVAGLNPGTKIRVLWEDREITAEPGQFHDDFRGTDLYQRHGGEHSGYGGAPVSFHVYEVGN